MYQLPKILKANIQHSTVALEILQLLTTVQPVFVIDLSKMASHQAWNSLSKRYHNSHTHAKHHGHKLRKSRDEGGTLIMHARHDSTNRHIDETTCYKSLQYRIVTR